MSEYRSRVSRLVAVNRRQHDQYNIPPNHSQVLRNNLYYKRWFAAAWLLIGRLPARLKGL